MLTVEAKENHNFEKNKWDEDDSTKQNSEGVTPANFWKI